MKRGQILNVHLRYTEPVLGTVAKDPKVFEDYIASKIVKRKDLTDEEKEKLKAEEVKHAFENIEAVEERGWTGFQIEEGVPFVYDYYLRGFFKTAIGTLQETGDLKKIVAYKSRIDRFVFIHPRRVPMILNEDPQFVLERPLRAMTPQGPRVTVTRSDALPIGTEIKFQVELLKNKYITLDTIKTSLEYGRYEGHGQWRSGSYGRFEVVSAEEAKRTEG